MLCRYRYSEHTFGDTREVSFRVSVLELLDSLSWKSVIELDVFNSHIV